MNKTIIKNIFLLLPMLCLLLGCAQEEPASTTTLLQQMEDKHVIQKSNQRSLRSTISEVETELYLSVIYVGDLDEILLNSSSHFGALIEAHGFYLTAPFEVDETMKGIILRTYDAIGDPITIAKEISNCEEVMMVEVKNIPQQAL